MKYPLKTRKFNRKWDKTQTLVAIVVVAAVTVLGYKLLVASHAATPYATNTANKGTTAGTTSTGACTGASDGSCVSFGSTGGGSNGAPAMPAVPSGYTRFFSGTFPTNAPVGDFDNVYGSQWGEYTNTDAPVIQPDGSEAAYVPNEVLSVVNNSMYYDLHTDSSGVPVAAAPQPDNDAGFLYGQVGVAVRMDSETEPSDYKIAFLLWPTTGDWTNEVDFAETQPNLDTDFSANSLLTNDAPNFDLTDGNQDTGVNLNDHKYHVFLVTWTPSALTISIDGVVKATFSANSGADPSQEMRASLQAEGWIGGNDEISPAASAVIDVPWFYINTMN